MDDNSTYIEDLKELLAQSREDLATSPLLDDAVEFINLTPTSAPAAPTPAPTLITTTGSTPELLSTTEDRQSFLRKLDLGPSRKVPLSNRTSSTVKPISTSTSTQATPATISATTQATPTTTTPKKRGYKYRPTYFFSTPTFGPPHQPIDQCLCPCAVAQVAHFSYDPNYDPFSEQKLLFELSRAYNRSLLGIEGDDEYSETGSGADYPEVARLPGNGEDFSSKYPETEDDFESIPGFESLPEPVPNPVAVKPNYFQAYEFIDILAKMQELEDVESNEAEPSGDLVICVRGFLGCIENKAYDWPEDDWPKTDSLADKARKCYLNFQACSGSAMLIPDRKDSPQV